MFDKVLNTLLESVNWYSMINARHYRNLHWKPFIEGKVCESAENRTGIEGDSS